MFQFLGKLTIEIELEQKKNGIPSIGKFNKAQDIRGSYLNDHLRIQTVRSEKDHFGDFIIEHAKYQLLVTNILDN